MTEIRYLSTPSMDGISNEESYSRGKTIDEMIAELKDGSGTRYAPWLAELVERKEVRDDLESQLKEGRESNYRSTYHLLKNVQEQAKNVIYCNKSAD